MRLTLANSDIGFEPPPRLGGIERRLTGLAREAWAAGGEAYVGGFDVNSVLIADPAGLALVEEVGDTIAAMFGIVPGTVLARRGGLASELAAACDLLALGAEPVAFETNLAAPSGACLLVRGIALPLNSGADTGKVQAIVNWREVLSRAASDRLRAELGAALRAAGRGAPKCDPFAAKSPW